MALLSARLSLSLKNRRFASSLTANDREMRKVCEGFTPQNTTKNTDWALRVFQEWEKQRNGDQCNSDLLEHPSAEKLNCWLSCFVAECRRVDGQPYSSIVSPGQPLTRYAGRRSGQTRMLHSCLINTPHVQFLWGVLTYPLSFPRSVLACEGLAWRD